MSNTEAARHPQRTGTGPEDERRASGCVGSTVPRWPSGCPCGCRTRLPWLDDPQCARHRPVTADPGLYDGAGGAA
jgi:hypothetical protein